MIAHLSYVMCDRCGNPAEPADYAKEARQLAKAHGFARIGREDVCPECMGRDWDGYPSQRPNSASEPGASPPLEQTPQSTERGERSS